MNKKLFSKYELIGNPDEIHWIKYTLMNRQFVFIQAGEFNHWISFGKTQEDQTPLDGGSDLISIVKVLYPN